MSDAAVTSTCPIKAIQHILAAPKIKNVDRSIPILTSFNLFLAPISAKKAANHKITNPPYDAPEAIGFPFPTCFITSSVKYGFFK